MLRGVYFFCPIGMKGGEEGSARVGSGETGGEGGAVGGAVVMLNVLFGTFTSSFPRFEVFYQTPIG